MQPPILTPPSLRERIGGRWAVSMRTFAVGGALATALSLATLSGFSVEPFGSAPATPAALAAQLAAMALWLILLDRTVLRNRREHAVPIWVVAATGALFAPIRIAVIAGIARLEGMPDVPVQAIALTAVPAIALSAVAPVLIAYVSATVEWYAGEREHLIALAAEREAERLRAVGALGALRDVALFAVQRDVATARSVLDDSERAPGEVADALLIAARTGVRPAAHALMERTDRRSRSAPFREAIRNEVLRAPLPLLLPAVALPIMTGPRIALRFGAAAAAASCVLFIACMLVVFPVGRRLIRRWPLHALGIAAVACIATPLPTVVLITSVFGGTAPIAQVIATTFLLTVLVLASSMPRVVDASSEAALAAMARPAATAEIERLAAERAQMALLREIGSHLHGKVQTGLVAASYAIQDALAREDAAALEIAITQARTALSQRITPSPTAEDPAPDPRAIIDREWRGLLRIRWEGPATSMPRDGDIVDVVRECLANAVVHGRAEAASIRVEAAADAITIEIEDDGFGPAGGPPGHGAAVLDDATARRWTITRTPSGGTLVRARIAS